MKQIYFVCHNKKEEERTKILQLKDEKIFFLSFFHQRKGFKCANKNLQSQKCEEKKKYLDVIKIP